MTEEEARVLAWTLLGEAGGEGDAGLRAVAHVIRNRSESGRFPSNPAAVALQSNAAGVHQFSTWNGLGLGGNLPRSRYPVGSSDFNRALSIVNSIFGPNPGKDPTLGATHYYSPKGMGGKAPYWWNSEAPLGGVTVGGHVFAKKREEDKVAPTPAIRTGSLVGRFPEKEEMQVFRSGRPVQLPVIGPDSRVPTPATPSLKTQIARENNGATVKSTQTMIYDPITKSLVPNTRTQTFAGQDGAKPSAKQTQRIAGFAVPIEGKMSTVDSRRVLENNGTSYVERLPPSKAQAQFGQPTTQPAGSVNNNKDQSQLTTPQQKPPTVDSLGFSRDGLARRQQAMNELNGGINVVGGPPVARRVAPVPQPRIQRQPPPTPTPAPALRIVVQRDPPIARVIRQTPVDALRSQGYSPSQAYDLANEIARQTARENASSPQHQSSNSYFNDMTNAMRDSSGGR